MRRIICVVILGMLGGCSPPLSEPPISPTRPPLPTPSPTPSPNPTITPTLVPGSTATSAPAASLSPPPAPTQDSDTVGFPYLPPGDTLPLEEVKMIGLQEGWAIHTRDGIPHLLKTGDGGATWADVTPPLSLRVGDELQVFRLMVSAEFIDADHAWASFGTLELGGFGSVWRTADGGSSWERVTLGRRTHGTDGLLLEALDAQHGWAVVNTFLGAGSSAGEGFRSTDGGESWERLLGEFRNTSGVDFVNAQVGWISTDVFAGVSPPWRLFITRDAGLTWESTAPGPDLPEPVPGHSQCDFILLRAQSARTGVVHRPNCRTADAEGRAVTTSWLDFTSDGGRTWESFPMPIGDPEFLNAQTGWVIGPPELQLSGPPSSWALFATEDGGRTWEPIRDMDWPGQLSFVDERNGWAVDGEGRLWHTGDGGETWDQVAARSKQSPPPQNLTVTFELPTDTPPIEPENYLYLRTLAKLPAENPTSLVIYRGRVFVGDAGGRILNWSLTTEENEAPGIWLAHSDWIYDLAAAENGAHVVSASRDGLIRQWDTVDAEGHWRESSVHSGEVAAVAVSPLGMTFASGGQDATVWVQELFGRQDAESRLELRGHQAWVWDLDFSPDGTQLASASADRTVRVWSPTSGEQLAVLRVPGSTVTQVEFSPDGSQIAAGSRDGNVRIWDAVTYELLTVLSQHQDWVLDLAYSPQGTILASSSADGLVLLWDPHKGELITTINHLNVPARGVSFDRSGRYLVTVTDDDQVYIRGLP